MTTLILTEAQLTKMTPLALGALYIALIENDLTFSRLVRTQLDNLIGKSDTNNLIDKYLQIHE